MHRLATLFVSLIAVALPVAAQDSPRVEVFGGYQYLHAGNFDHAGDSINTNGWDVAAAFNFTRHFGAAADFSGSYKQDNGAQVHIYTYTFGPVASENITANFRIFAHALFGAAHLPTGCLIFSGSPDECGSGVATGFAMLIGGGVDAKVTKHFNFRLVQVDWARLPSEFGATNGNVRVSTGAVLRF
jgi:hypothetical protein